MSDLAATAALYSARPKLALDGTDEEQLASGLLSLSVHENEEGLYRCELCFGNWGSNSEPVGYLYFDRQTLDFGKRITIDIGDGDAAATIFEGKITGIEGRFTQERPPEILVLAEDRLQDLRMARRTRTFEDMALGDVIEQIASAHGLRTSIDIDSPTYRILAQLNQSDLAFLRERAQAVDAELWIEVDTLHAQARSRRKTGELTLTYGQRLQEFSALADLAHQRTHLTIGGWDVAAKTALDQEADTSVIQSELNGGLSGPKILEERFGRRRDSIVHFAPATTDEARTVAQSLYRKMARRFVTGRGVAEGDGRIRAGSHLTLEGLGDLFSGRYYITEAHHTFSLSEGYRTYFSVERPWIGI